MNSRPALSVFWF